MTTTALPHSHPQELMYKQTMALGSAAVDDRAQVRGSLPPGGDQPADHGGREERRAPRMVSAQVEEL
ncbi:hypothetical protein, partial [Mycolicibacterium insubricum]|uniref:hypothetical protein n=1 Tax=Mycolicibacterium insubricum TaxID=444597 RepID=UPI0021F25E86